MSERRKDFLLAVWLVFLAVFAGWVIANLPLGEIRRPDQAKCEDAGGIYMGSSRTCAFPTEANDD